MFTKGMKKVWFVAAGFFFVALHYVQCGASLDEKLPMAFVFGLLAWLQVWQ